MDKAHQLLKHYPYVYCPTMSGLFKLYANPKRGDIVIFNHNGVFTHTGIVTGVDGDYFTTVEGNTSAGSAVVGKRRRCLQKRILYQQSCGDEVLQTGL